MTTCSHLNQIRDVPPRGKACEECLESGLRWVALRKCLICGNVGCCDSSPGRHARGHFHATQHPLIEPLESAQWTWCYVDNDYVHRVGAQPHA
jgi:uncharacterized UBP type Zn finger protein